MDLLRKSVTDGENVKQDNSDKKLLFPKDRHPQTADFYKEQWSFVEDQTTRENIAYQMQYLEFTINLYNDYQIYLTIESLMCKNIIVTVGGIIEATIFDLIQSARKKRGLEMEERTDFTKLLGSAFHEYHFIDEDMWHYLHELRKKRNLVHLKAADFQEHTAYTFEQANESLVKLSLFQGQVSSKLS